LYKEERCIGLARIHDVPARYAIITGVEKRHYRYDTFELTWEAWDLRVKATFSTDARGDIVALAAPLEPTVGDIIFERVPDQALRDHGFLAQFVGSYELIGAPMSIAFKDEATLLARLPGQPDVELVPRRGREFAVKGLSGYGIEFVCDDAGTVVEALVTQPWGSFTAKRR
jgi:hypothetical protein